MKKMYDYLQSKNFKGEVSVKYLKNFVLLSFLCITLLIFKSTSIYAQPNIKVYIDGQKMNFTQNAVIKNGSTMVPYRDIFEKLGARVDYDVSKQIVTGTRGKESVKLTIGDTNAYINGIKKSLNEAPFIVNGRTMVPLRFISEALGADVNWDESTYTVNISTAPYKCYILGFYAVRSYPQFERRADDFNEASTYWFDVNQDGSIKLSLPDGYEEVRKIADKSGTKLSAMIMGDRAIVSSILSDNAKRVNLENNIIETALNYNYDGVNIDFEGLEGSDRDNFTLFLEELKAMTDKNNLKLLVSVPPMTTYTTWYQGYDFKAIGSISDSVILMTYDYRNSSTDAGPIAPYWWVDEVINYALNNGIPADKALLGIDFYGYDWIGNTEAQSLTLDEVINKLGGQPYRFDEGSLSPNYIYNKNGVEHTIWFENSDSIDLKLKLARMYRLKGVAFWRIGTITESQLQGFDIWNVINKDITKIQ